MKSETIEVDEETAAALKECAASRGISVSEVVAELVPLAMDSDDIAELDRRWAAVKAGAPTYSNDEVVRWLRTWGTPDYKPWSEK